MNMGLIIMKMSSYSSKIELHETAASQSDYLLSN